MTKKKRPYFLNFYFYLGIVFLICLILSSWAFLLTAQLKTGFVESKFNSKDSSVSYEIVSSPPQKWIPIEKISPGVYHSIIVSEDWSFFQHKGIDLIELKKAIFESQKRQEWVRGASTISQQVVKNVFLSHEKSLKRKLIEVFLTVFMELQVSKKKILEIYLNIVEFGEGLYGIKNAAMFYFKKDPLQLTHKEASFLAMLLPNPKKYSLSFRKKELTPYASETMEQILLKMLQAKSITEPEYETAIGEELSFLLKRNSKVEKKSKQKKYRKIIEGARRGNDDGRNFEKRFRYDKDLDLRNVKLINKDESLNDNSNSEEEFSLE